MLIFLIQKGFAWLTPLAAWRMQIARPTPALRLATDGVATGRKRIHYLLKIIDPTRERISARPELFMERRRPRSTRRGKGATPAGAALGRSAAERPECPLPAEQGLENAQNGKG